MLPPRHITHGGEIFKLVGEFSSCAKIRSQAAPVRALLNSFDVGENGSFGLQESLDIKVLCFSITLAPSARLLTPIVHPARAFSFSYYFMLTKMTGRPRSFPC